jgi:hypothetical protein
MDDARSRKECYHEYNIQYSLSPGWVCEGLHHPKICKGDRVYLPESVPKVSNFPKLDAYLQFESKKSIHARRPSSLH